MREQKGFKGRRKYDEEFKRSAVRMIQSGQSVRSVSEVLESHRASFTSGIGNSEKNEVWMSWKLWS